MCWPISFSRLWSRPSVVRKWSRSCFLLVIVASGSVSGHVGAPDRVLRSSNRHHGHGGGLHGQRRKVLGLKAVHVGLAAGARHHLTFHRQRMKEIVNAFSSITGVEPPAQIRVL